MAFFAGDSELNRPIKDDDTYRSRLHKVPADLSKFWVVVVISNSVRYKRRYELYWLFAEMCRQAGVHLVTVEQAFGDRQFMVTEANNPYHLQVRTIEELWYKENLINMGIAHCLRIAPGQVREVCWVDADCRPMCNPRTWFEETWHELQHYKFVQMWSSMVDLNYDGEMVGEPMPSFMANYIKYGSPNQDQFHKIISDDEYALGVGKKSKIFGRPGLAWACQIQAFKEVGGLIDWSILGASDWYMAHALIGTFRHVEGGTREGPYFQKILKWQDNAQKWIKRDVGYVKATMAHEWHGKKINRAYGSRGKILSECKYNPDTDLKYDEYGMLQLETWDDRQIELRDRIRQYFRARNEDEIS